MAGKEHPGFKSVQGNIAGKLREKGMGEKEASKRAGAILAKKTRQASPAAKKANPRLRRVKG